MCQHVAWETKTKRKENEVMFRCGPEDLLLSLLHVMDVEKYASLLLEASEIIRIILDTEILEEQNNSFKLDLDGCDVTSTLSLEHHRIKIPFWQCVMNIKFNSC